MAGKGDKSRVNDLKSYWSCPLWDNMKNKTYNSYAEFSNDFSSVVEEVEKPFRALFIDDIREPKNAYIWDEDRTLQQVSGIAHFKWDIVRSYDEFVAYVEKNGIPDVVSYDNDLFDVCADRVSEEQVNNAFQMIDWENSPIKSGAHCAAWLCERCKALQHPLPKYYVHSANSAARPIIRGLMEAARPFIKH